MPVRQFEGEQQAANGSLRVRDDGLHHIECVVGSGIDIGHQPRDALELPRRQLGAPIAQMLELRMLRHDRSDFRRVDTSDPQAAVQERKSRAGGNASTVGWTYPIPPRFASFARATSSSFSLFDTIPAASSWDVPITPAQNSASSAAAPKRCSAFAMYADMIWRSVAFPAGVRGATSLL